MAFLALHAVVWTVLPTLFFINLPLDLIEGLVYGREWQLGYDKLPPLPWWMLEATYRVFGPDLFFYALSQLTVMAAFALIWVMARQLVGPVGALVAILIIDGMHYFTFTAAKFNHDVVQLPFWATDRLCLLGGAPRRPDRALGFARVRHRDGGVGQILRRGAGGAARAVCACSTATRASRWPRRGPGSRSPWHWW